MKTGAIAMIAGMLALAAVNLSAQPVITTQPTNQTVMLGCNATFVVGVSGTGPFTYQWQLNTTNLPNGIITTVAGNGTMGYSGDGGPATNTSLSYPSGVAVDGSGNLFIADDANNRIREVSTNGIIATVAGNGTVGYLGDGEGATNASLYAPFGVSVDFFGDLFIADSGNRCIRKVSTNGIITTVAGSGTNGYSGDGGVATNASLKNPIGVAVDTSGNLFIADYGNDRIRKVSTNGIISTVAGNGAKGYSGDGGAATSAKLYGPSGVAVDISGNLFIVDGYNDRIRKVSTNGIISTVAGNGMALYSGDGGWATNAQVAYPTGLGMDGAGNLFIADTYNNRIRKISTNGIITTVAGNGTIGFSGDGGSATNASLQWPTGVAVDAAGNLFIADPANNMYVRGNERIRKVTNTQGPALALNNVTAANAGNYQVVVTGPGGSVTSSVPTLTVAVPPNIQSFWQTNGVFNFTWVAVSNLSYQVQYTTNLALPNWSNLLGSPITATNGTLSASDSIGDMQRFYRVLLLLP